MKNSLLYFFLSKYHHLLEIIEQTQQKRKYNNLKQKSINTIKRIDNLKISTNEKQIRLFAIMRNESLRISHFINYYVNLGVDSLFIIDNNSTDCSIDLVLSHQKVHVFKTEDTYKNHWYWMEYLLETYGKDHWCIVVDIDELIYWPYFDSVNLPILCQYLESTNSLSVRSLLLDMYSDEVLHKIVYKPNSNPLEILTFFDSNYTTTNFSFFDKKKWNFFNQTTFIGGMRERFFGKNIPYHLSKISIFKYTEDTYLTQGMHAINGSSISDLQFVTFHTKFLGDFIEEIQEESKREQHYGNAIVYKIFNKVLNEKPECLLWHEASVKFEGFSQLIDLGLLKSNTQFDEFVRIHMSDTSECLIKYYNDGI